MVHNIPGINWDLTPFFKINIYFILLINFGMPLSFAAETNSVTANQEMERTKEIERLKHEMQRMQSQYPHRPRHKYIDSKSLSKSPPDYQKYIQNWVKKIEHIGTTNYPAAALNTKHPTKVIVDVGINADGTLQKIRIIKRSGDTKLDNSVVALVKMAAPFAPFPEAIKREADILHITRVWNFIPNSKNDNKKSSQETTTVK